MVSGGFKKKRQNVIGICAVIILIKHNLIVVGEGLDPLNINVVIKPEGVSFITITLFIYFTWRLIIHWKDHERPNFYKDFDDKVFVRVVKSYQKKITTIKKNTLEEDNPFLWNQRKKAVMGIVLSKQLLRYFWTTSYSLEYLVPLLLIGYTTYIVIGKFFEYIV